MASESEKTSLIEPSSVFSPDEEEKKIPDDLEYPITSFTDYQSDMTQFLFTFESDHMPKENYGQRLKTNDLDINTFREESLHSIDELLGRKFHEFVLYYAVNYLDRFLSVQNFLNGTATAVSCFSLAAKAQIPEFVDTDDLESGNSWMSRAIAVSCFSLTARTILNCNHDGLERFGYVLDGNVKQVECLIIGALKGIMHPVTPFSFLYFFISLAKLEYQEYEEPLIRRTAEIIFKLQKEIDLLEFKPSIIAASAILIAFKRLFPWQLSSFTDEITSSIFINKDRLVACSEIMKSILMNSKKPKSVSDIVFLEIPELYQKLQLNLEAPSDDSTMVEPADRDDNDPITQEKDIFQDQQK